MYKTTGPGSSEKKKKNKTKKLHPVMYYSLLRKLKTNEIFKEAGACEEETTSA